MLDFTEWTFKESRVKKTTVSKPDKVWRVSSYGNVNRALDVWPIGMHDRDFEGMSLEEASAKRHAFLDAGNRFGRGELVSIDDLGGPVWAWRRSNAKGDKAPNFMNLGGHPAANAACKAVMEQADLGAINFHPIRILNAGRKSEPWPEEIYVVNVGNAKEALAIDVGLGDGRMRDSSSPGFETPPELLRYSVEPSFPVPLTTAALGGPDIWMDPKMLSGGLFISDRLAKLLKDAKMAGGWGLKECSILDV